MRDLASWWWFVDGVVAACLLPAAIAILISGLDDLTLDLVCLWAWIRQRFETGPPAPASEARPEKLTAVFVPLWREHSVIAGMVEHNVAAIRYGSYQFFIGAYPNDELTLDAVRELEQRFPHVHLAVCPHDGPTSKADCLNWVYQRMLLFEEHHNVRFEIVVTHDAEDLIHPEALAQINAHSDRYEMIQIPVLPLPTPFPSLVHSIYCDEFAEWQLKDMRVRQWMGSFIPSNGVGTGFTRAALEKLASAEHNLIFEPTSLTEDYVNGLRLHDLGCRQVFVQLTGRGRGLIATREFFPQTARSAIRQRSRWITGIALQCWERHGWHGKIAQVYWLWRDRKGLLGNPLSLFTNLLFAYGALSWLASKLSGNDWGLARHSLHPRLLAATLCLQAIQSAVRFGCVARLYGIFIALGVPVRSVCANWINSLATFRALYRYFRARLLGEPLVWLKTEHAYPSRTALIPHKRKLGEVLIGCGHASAEMVEEALASIPDGIRLGEHLLRLGMLGEEELYEALGLQQSLPTGRIAPEAISKQVARSLPRRVIRELQVLPFRIASGSLFLASPEIPSDEMTRTLSGFTRLALRFHLVTPGNFDELSRVLL